MRLLVGSGLVLWIGVTLLLSELRWFARPPLAERLRPYAPGGMAGGGRFGLWSVASFRAAIGPVSRALGERFSALLWVGEDAGTRLARIHSPLDVTGFRVRQVGWATAAFGVGALVTVAARPNVLLVGLLLLGGPVLAFAVVERHLEYLSDRWKRRVFLELPIVAEQVAMLLSAGYSLTGALHRVARRSNGAVAADLRRVTRRMRQGLSETEALREWAETARVDALDRLVAVLALNQEASDLGRLLSAEARAVRRDVHRELIETVERRGQQVWIPVTVATLLPGVVFMAIPFIEALRLFSA